MKDAVEKKVVEEGGDEPSLPRALMNNGWKGESAVMRDGGLFYGLRRRRREKTLRQQLFPIEIREKKEKKRRHGRFFLFPIRSFSFSMDGNAFVTISSATHSPSNLMVHLLPLRSLSFRLWHNVDSFTKTNSYYFLPTETATVDKRLPTVGTFSSPARTPVPLLSHGNPNTNARIHADAHHQLAEDNEVAACHKKWGPMNQTRGLFLATISRVPLRLAVLTAQYVIMEEVRALWSRDDSCERRIQEAFAFLL